MTFPDSFFPVDTLVIEDTSTPDDVDIPDVFTEDSPPATCASDTPFTAFPGRRRRRFIRTRAPLPSSPRT